MKEFTREEFQKWCEQHFLDVPFKHSVWRFIQNQKVELQLNTDEHGDSSELIIKLDLSE